MPSAADDEPFRLRRLTGGDVDAYLALREHSFGYPDDDAVRTRLLARMPLVLGAFAADRLVASATGYVLDTFVAGRAARMLAVAAVQTAPEARRRGLARRLLRGLLDDARADGVGWSLLYPFEPTFYDRLGWQALTTGVRLLLPIDGLGGPARTSARPVLGPWRAALEPVHGRCVRAWNLTAARTSAEPFDVWDELRPARGARASAFDLGDAYAVLQLRDDGAEGTTLDVLDASWADATGRDALLTLLRSYHGQAQRVRLDVPADDPLAWSFGDWYAEPTRATRMARVVDVAAAIDGLPWPADAAVTLRVRDALAPWNDGRWRVAGGADGARVEPAPPSAPCDATLDVRALATLVVGGARPTALVRAGLAEGSLEALERVAGLAGGRTPYHALPDRF